jgi:LPXTG-site transpeptidase (sortase) family protein
MERKQLKLDSPEFTGKLRYNHRSSAYIRRPVVKIQDVVAPKSIEVPLITQTSSAAFKTITAQSLDFRQVRKPLPTVPVRAQAQPHRIPVRPVVVQESKQNYSRADAPQRSRISKSTAVLYAMAGLLFTGGLFVSWSGLNANHQVVAQVKHAQTQTDQTVADNVVPSVVKPSDTTVRSYAVAPTLPKYLDIPKLKLHTRILSEGVTKSGQLQVPWNIYDTGWYNSSSQPGQTGAMLVDGHSGIGKMHGVFYELATLFVGDPISVTRGDGQVVTYKVAKVQTVIATSVDMASMIVSADTAKPGLNLITCAGDVIPGTTELNKRVLVYAVMQ